MSKKHSKRTQEALNWTTSQEHAQRLLKAIRFTISLERETIRNAEVALAQKVETLNAIKARMLAEGWEE